MAPLIPEILRISAGLFQWLVRQMIYSTVIILPVLLILHMYKKSSIQFKQTLWLLFWIRLILPPDFSFLFSLRQMLSRILLLQTQLSTTDPVRPVSLLISNISNPVISNLFEMSVPFHIYLFSTLFFLWFCGLIFFGFLYVRSMRFYKKLIDTSKSVSNKRIIFILEKWKKRLRLHRDIKLVTARRAISPFATGIFHPTLFIPASLLESGNISLLESVIAHELAHIRYWDTFWIHCQSCLQIIYFFHPAVWIAGHHTNAIRESLADLSVIQNNRFSRDLYSRCLIALIKLNYMEAYMKASILNNKKTLFNRIAILGSLYRLSFSKCTGLAFMLIAAVFLILPMHEKTRAVEIAQSSQQKCVSLPENHIFCSPLPDQKIVLTFGPALHPFNKKDYHHNGVDISGRIGTPILAAANGYICIANDPVMLKKGFGHHVMIQHKQGFQTLYAHMDTVLVRYGQVIKQGDCIGTVGNTGLSTGPHLHFELHLNGEPVNPEKYLTF
ncbi:peptidoglycan DD-metalloendopeptidase family protein [bacterium]|nr:peptidoglycan DD-metalloendopeptidase family protein [bacterium]